MGTLSTLPSAGLAGRDLLRISDLSSAEAESILDLAAELKLNPKEPRFPGATLGLYFAKNSTRTRVSFTVATTAARRASARRAAVVARRVLAGHGTRPIALP